MAEDLTNEDLEAAAFVGDAVAPLFLYEPGSADLQATLDAYRALDADQAAAEWPFGEETAVRQALLDVQDGLRESDVEALKWEYRRMFTGPGHIVTPQWGSVYTDRECVMFGKATIALDEWMAEHGIDRIAGKSTPSDHFGLMLELMAWIARNKPECLQEFLEQHLLTWAHHFLGEVQSETHERYLRGAAELADASLAGMQESFGLQVTEPRFYR